MGTGAIVILGLLGFGILILAVLNIFDGRKSVNDLVRFQRSFPGKCPVCSFRHYGKLHGFDVGPPEQHVCPDEIARTESNRLPEQGWRRDGRGVTEVDVSQLSLREAIQVVHHHEEIFLPREP